MDNLKGKFIVLEGGEGSGKSTVAKMLYEHLSKEIDVTLTRDPGGTVISDKIRSILLDNKSNVSPNTELYLYHAARAQLIDEVIKPALNQGKCIICDRFYHSSMIYQGYCQGHNLDTIKNLNQYICGYTLEYTPNVVFYLDVDPEIGLKRSLARLNKDKIEESRLENKGLEFHKEVIKGYRLLAKQSHRTYQIDSTNQSIEEIFSQILRLLKDF